MQAYRIVKPFAGEVLETPLPEMRQNEALIRIHYSGICGSDLHTYEGRHVRRCPPLVPGHECSGVVEAVGNRVTLIRPGCRVAVLPERGCGECACCRAGRTNLCASKTLLGTAAWPGGFAEYITAPEEQIFELPDRVPLRLAALAEPLAVAAHALRQADVRPGRNTLLFGAGGIGSLILTLARLRGVGQSIVCDLKAFNLELALRQGASFALNTGTRSAAEQLARLPQAAPSETAFIAASHHDLINQCFPLIRPGGVIALVGQFNRPGVIDIDKARIREQTLVSSFTYVREDFREALEALGKDPEAFDPLITREISLAETDSCLREMLEGRLNAVKVLIRLC